MNLSDVKVVDLKKSVFDTSEIDAANKRKALLVKQKASQAKLDEVEKQLIRATEDHQKRMDEQRYRFSEKVLIDKRFFSQDPDFKLKWGSFIRDGEDLEGLRMDGWDFVTPEDQLWPEGARLVDGQYRFKDMVLLKLPLNSYIEKKKQLRDKQNRKLQAVDTKFKSEVKKTGSVGFGGPMGENDDITDFLGQ